MWISFWTYHSTLWKWSPAIWKWTSSRSSFKTSRVASRSITLILWFRGHRTSCKRYCKIQFFLLGEQVRFVLLICFKVILIKSCAGVPEYLSIKVQITKPKKITARSCLTFIFVRLHVCESFSKAQKFWMDHLFPWTSMFWILSVSAPKKVVLVTNGWLKSTWFPFSRVDFSGRDLNIFYQNGMCSPS